MHLTKLVPLSIVFVMNACIGETPGPDTVEYDTLWDNDTVFGSGSITSGPIDHFHQEDRHVLILKSILGQPDSYEDFPLDIQLYKAAEKKKSEWAREMKNTTKKENKTHQYFMQKEL